MTKESKRIARQPVTIRKTDGKIEIVGLAAVFNSDSRDIGFIERIHPGAFEGADLTDVVALFNHDPNFILGSTRSGSLDLHITESGLQYVARPPGTNLINDMVISPMQRGDIGQSSFAFFIDEDIWDFTEETPRREILKISRVVDVSPVTYPAYSSTFSGIRANAQNELKRALEGRKNIYPAWPYDYYKNYLIIKNKKNAFN